MGLLRLTTDADLPALLSSQRLLLFKHSPTCPVSAHAFFECRAFLEDHPEVDAVWIDVIEQRPASSAITDSTGLAHESPQALWLEDGKVAWHASHGAITRAALAEATGVE